MITSKSSHWYGKLYFIRLYKPLCLTAYSLLKLFIFCKSVAKFYLPGDPASNNTFCCMLRKISHCLAISSIAVSQPWMLSDNLKNEHGRLTVLLFIVGQYLSIVSPQQAKTSR